MTTQNRQKSNAKKNFCNTVLATLAINSYTSKHKINVTLSHRKLHPQKQFRRWPKSSCQQWHVEIVQKVAKVKLLIVACITALTPIIYNSVYSDFNSNTLGDGRNRFNVMNFKFGIIQIVFNWLSLVVWKLGVLTVVIALQHVKNVKTQFN